MLKECNGLIAIHHGGAFPSIIFNLNLLKRPKLKLSWSFDKTLQGSFDVVFSMSVVNLVERTPGAISTKPLNAIICQVISFVIMV